MFLVVKPPTSSCGFASSLGSALSSVPFVDFNFARLFENALTALTFAFKVSRRFFDFFLFLLVGPTAHNVCPPRKFHTHFFCQR